MKNSAPHTIRISMVWPKSGSITNSGHQHQEQHQRHRGRRHFRPPGDSANSHAASTTKGGLGGFGRLDVDADQRNPAPRTLDLRPEHERRHDQRDRDREHDQRRAADLPRRQERHPDHHDEGRQQEQDVTVEEVEGIEPDPGRHRRTRGQRQDDPAQDQRDDRPELQTVDRPPPFAERIALFTGEHGHSQGPKGLPIGRPGWFPMD